MIESLRCNTCIHCHVCHAVAECTNTLYPCNDYEEKRPRGEWKQVTAKDGEYYCYHKCTNCGQTIESGFDNPPIFNFCPNCGADMREERQI